VQKFWTALSSPFNQVYLHPFIHLPTKSISEVSKQFFTSNFSTPEKELMNAYKRAGSAFKGQMQQNFVVLNENGFGADVIDSARRAGP
jgi:hypothetical protein